jgi:hypothetical protein
MEGMNFGVEWICKKYFIVLKECQEKASVLYTILEVI